MNSDLFNIALKLFILEQCLLISAAIVFVAVRLIKYFRARRRRHRNLDDRIAELEETIHNHIFNYEEKRTSKKSRFK